VQTSASQTWNCCRTHEDYIWDHLFPTISSTAAMAPSATAKDIIPELLMKWEQKFRGSNIITAEGS